MPQPTKNNIWFERWLWTGVQWIRIQAHYLKPEQKVQAFECFGANPYPPYLFDTYWEEHPGKGWKEISRRISWDRDGCGIPVS